MAQPGRITCGKVLEKEGREKGCVHLSEDDQVAYLENKLVGEALVVHGTLGVAYEKSTVLLEPVYLYPVFK